MRRLSSENFSFFPKRHARPYEKSAKGYISFFNAKGSYFVKGKEGFEVKSIYTDNRTGYTLPKRTSQYLSSIPDLNKTLKEQQPVMNDLIKDGRDNLKNLWTSRHNRDNGLRKCISQAVERKTSVKQNRLLRKGVYAISSLLGNRGRRIIKKRNFKKRLTHFFV